MQSFKVNAYFRMIWVDPRLSYADNSQFNSSDSLTLDYTHKSLLWLPDIFIENEAVDGDFHSLTVPNILLRLSPDGTIFLSQRFATKSHIISFSHEIGGVPSLMYDA